MVWDTISSGGKKVAAFNHWPNPFNYVTNAQVLMCNDQYWLAEFAFFGAQVVNMFWTDFVPSPREIERKAFTGAYRCGFFLDVGIKSPVEIVFGQGTSRMLAEIAEPFARGLFYMWMTQVGIDALAIWESVLFPQLACLPNIGDVLRQGDVGTITTGDNGGSIGLGTKLYDPHHYNDSTGPLMTCGPGSYSIYEAWLFDPGNEPITEIWTGWQLNGDVIDVQSHGGCAPEQQKLVIRQKSGFQHQTSTIQPYWRAISPPRIQPGIAGGVRFVGSYNPLAEVNDFHSMPPTIKLPRPPAKCFSSDF